MDKGLYNIEYLEKTNALLFALKEASYKPFLALSGVEMIDVGCGMGQDVINLAALNNNLSITGIDASSEMIAKARTLEYDTLRVRFLEHLADSLPFENQSIHGLRNERLIQHLKAPLAAFQEFYRVLVPGAPIVSVETDWTSMRLYCGNESVLKKLSEFYANGNVANGMSALAISSYLEQSGFSDIEIRIHPVVSYDLHQVYAFTRLDLVLESMLAKNVISFNEKNDFVHEIERAHAQGYFSAALNLVIATAKK